MDEQGTLNAWSRVRFLPQPPSLPPIVTSDPYDSLVRSEGRFRHTGVIVAWTIAKTLAEVRRTCSGVCVKTRAQLCRIWSALARSRNWPLTPYDMVII